MTLNDLIPWLFAVIIIGPFIIKWFRKREAYSSANLSNEIPVRWRKFDTSKNKQPYSGWIGSSSRSVMRITSDGIYCDHIAIPFSKIKKAIVYSPGDHPFIKESANSIMRIETGDTIYDFAVSPYRLTKMELPFELKHEPSHIVPKAFTKVLFPIMMLLAGIIMFISKSC